MAFADILEQSPDVLEASKPLPAGEYEFQVIKADIEALKFDFGEAHPEGTENLVIYSKPVTPVEVDPEELEACETWRNEILSTRIFEEEMGDRLCDIKTQKGFAYDCGLDPADFPDVMTMIAALAGKRFLGTVVHSPNKKDPDKPYQNLRGTAPL